MATLKFEVFGSGKSWADLADEEDDDLKPLSHNDDTLPVSMMKTSRDGSSVTPPPYASPSLRATPAPSATSPLSTASTPSPSRTWNKINVGVPSTFALSSATASPTPSSPKDIDVSSPPSARPLARGKAKSKSSSRAILFPKAPEPTPEESFDPYLDNSRDGLPLLLKGAGISGPSISSAHPPLNAVVAAAPVAAVPAPVNVWQQRSSSSAAAAAVLSPSKSVAVVPSLPFAFGSVEPAAPMVAAEPVSAFAASSASLPVSSSSSSTTLAIPSVEASPTKSPQKRRREDSSSSTAAVAPSSRALFATPATPLSPGNSQWNRSSSLLVQLGKDAMPIAPAAAASPSRDESPARKKGRTGSSRKSVDSPNLSRGLRVGVYSPGANGKGVPPSPSSTTAFPPLTPTKLNFNDDTSSNTGSDIGSAPSTPTRSSSNGSINGAGKPTPPVLSRTDRMKQRQKQIDIGKRTIGYQRYCAAVPREVRSRDHPATPKIGKSCSKRSWDGQVKKWRRQLHQYDPADMSAEQKENEAAAEASATVGDEEEDGVDEADDVDEPGTPLLSSPMASRSSSMVGSTLLLASPIAAAPISVL